DAPDCWVILQTYEDGSRARCSKCELMFNSRLQTNVGPSAPGEHALLSSAYRSLYDDGIAPRGVGRAALRGRGGYAPRSKGRLTMDESPKRESYKIHDRFMGSSRHTQRKEKHTATTHLRRITSLTPEH